MTPAVRLLLRDCARAGVGLAIDGDSIAWTCQDSEGTEPLIDRLRAAKPEILAALAEPATRPNDPRWAVALLADVGLWRSWMRQVGPDGPRDDADGWAAYLVVVGAA